MAGKLQELAQFKQFVPSSASISWIDYLLPLVLSYLGCWNSSCWQKHSNALQWEVDGREGLTISDGSLVELPVIYTAPMYVFPTFFLVMVNTAVHSWRIVRWFHYQLSYRGVPLLPSEIPGFPSRPCPTAWWSISNVRVVHRVVDIQNSPWKKVWLAKVTIS